MKTIKKIDVKRIVPPTRKRVAAYARVSMESDRLDHSLSAQISYYNDLIQNNPEWDFAGIYADSFISGTNVERRAEFQRMIRDCEDGKIDIILTKSISRFARNTVDLLKTVRRLKELGIEVQFEKESIRSLSGDGELMLTLLASFAQEESRSISENIKWGTRKRFERGIPSCHFKIFGYRWKGEHLVIIPEEAEIVKRIYQNFLDGKSRLETVREFAAEGVTTRRGYHWSEHSIRTVLTNITYTGNLLLQKQFTTDPISKKQVMNMGQLPQYFVENTHEEIIDMKTFRHVQDEMKRRQELGPLANKSLNITCFTRKIKCGKCGSSFVRCSRRIRVKYHSTLQPTNGRYYVWDCGRHRMDPSLCETSEIPEILLKKCCTEVLGLDEFDEQIFAKRIERIDVPYKGLLLFKFTEGEVVSKEWCSTARKDLWTDELKSKLRESRRNYLLKGIGRYSPFTYRIKCGCCGEYVKRQSEHKSVNHKVFWRCRNRCGIKGILEEELKTLSAEAIGIKEFDGELFMSQIDHVTTIKTGLIEFFFKDGHTKLGEYTTKPRHPEWTEERRKAMSEKIKQIKEAKKNGSK